MNLSKLPYSLLSVLVVPLLLTGCWDRREINDAAFVAATAFDKEEGKYRVTVQIPLPEQMGVNSGGGGGGGGSTSGAKPWYVDSELGDTIKESNVQQQRSLSRQLQFSHRRVFLIGEELAKDGVAPIIDILGRVPQNRLTTLMLVTKGSARDILSAETPTEQFPAEAIREIAQNSMKKPKTLKHFIQVILSEGIDPALPIISLDQTKPGLERQSEIKIKLDGLAVFNGSKLSGFLKGEEASGMLLAMNQAKSPIISVPSPDKSGNIAVQLLENESRIIPVLKNNQLTLLVQIRAKGTIVENLSKYNAGDSNNNLNQVEHVINQKVKANIEKSVKTLQHQYHSDPIGFGDAIYRKYPKLWKKYRNNWYDHYSRLKVVVEPLIQLKNTGAAVSPLGRKAGESRK